MKKNCSRINVVILINFIACLFLYSANNYSLCTYPIRFYENCISNNMSYEIMKRFKCHIYGKDLWSEILKNKNIFLYKFFNKMNIFKINNSYYYHRLYSTNYTNKIISVNGFFPDKSYLRLLPKNKRNYNNVITHTYEVQNFIFKYQHPPDCKKNKYLIIRGFHSGHGSEIHVLTSYLALALSINRIAILDPYYKTKKAYGKYCKELNNWLCFLEQFTNCSLPLSAYRNAKKYKNINQTDKYIYIERTQAFKNIIPKEIYRIIQNSPLYDFKILHYWRIQASTYIFRINKRTDIKTHKIISNSFGNSLHNGCFSIWVRHGDKFKEMKLLKAEDYLSSHKIFKYITNSNVPVYLSTDDPNVTKYFDNVINTKTFYLKFKRKNDLIDENIKRGDEMTLNFIADIKAAMYCNGFSGTRKSNVVRLIDELRSTIGLSANSIYFENGNIKFADSSYENYEYW